MTHQVESVMNQQHLEKVLRGIFIGEEIISNARKETDIKNPATNYFLEVDIWIPKFNLCFEFQDPYHYVSTWDSQHSVKESHKADNLKHELLCQRGETLIVVPCWWLNDPVSLIRSIKFQRPDLNLYVPKSSLPIPLNQPWDFFKELALSATIPMVGELMLASFVKSQKFELSASSTWWIGEKYDGVRFCWNAKTYRLYSRNGLKLHVPRQFLRMLAPGSSFLDGEVWFGRGQFSEVQQLVIANVHPSISTPWPLIRMVVFDDPGPLTQHLPFEKRYASVLDAVQHENPIAVVATRLLCASKTHLSRMLQHSIDEGGEGVILRKPGSVYAHGRSLNLLKLKAARADNEALVVDAEDAQSLLLQLPNGVTFRAPIPEPEDQIRAKPIKKGDIVTFLYESYSRNSIPLKPTVSRVRRDTSWTHVVRDFHASVPKKAFLNQSSDEIVQFSPKPHRFWTSDNKRNLRLFFENIAKSRNFDPLIAENWYSLTNKVVESYKGGDYALKIFNSSLSTAIDQIFPEICIDKSRFKHVYQRYWFDIRNRRKFFESYAAKHNFDPLVPENWYSVLKESIIKEGGRGIIDFYPQSNVRAAILHAFPDIGLDQNKYPTKDRHYWTATERRREFFVSFAGQHNFDPLVPANWYPISHEDIITAKGGYAVLEYYSRNHHLALSSLFPDIGLCADKFYRRRNS
eukprot:Phypoly_transcript_03271.p1 GENE.Phypoly_transcript_03271~~Phypoly_transcript_03271.p1  ORF type:complete len:688 (+),score=73.27 Phypoly_transcript_03271:396-2459(+)